LNNFYKDGYNPEFQKMAGERPKGVKVWKIPIPFANVTRQLYDTATGHFKDRLNDCVNNIESDLDEYIKPAFRDYVNESHKHDLSLKIMSKLQAACELSGGVAPKEYFRMTDSPKNNMSKNVAGLNKTISSLESDMNANVDKLEEAKSKKLKKAGWSIAIRAGLTAISIASAGALTVVTKPVDFFVQLGQEIAHDATANSLIESGISELMDKGFDMIMENHSMDLLGGGPVHNALANAIDIAKNNIEAGSLIDLGINTGDHDLIDQGWEIYDNGPGWHPSDYAEHGRTRIEFIKDSINSAKDYLVNVLHPQNITDNLLVNGADGLPRVKSMAEFLA
jgi:outer membrane murein-binding lipoprotein Lpp